MVDWDEIKKELKKLTPEKAIEYLKYLLETLKDKEVLENVKKEIENIKEVITQKKDWKKTADIIPIRRDVLNELESMSRPARREINLERAVETIEKDLGKPEEKSVEYNKGNVDYGQYLSDRIDMGYDKPNSTFNRERLTQNPERRHLELIEQQRKGGYKETEVQQQKQGPQYETKPHIPEPVKAPGSTIGEFKYESSTINTKVKKSEI